MATVPQRPPSDDCRATTVERRIQVEVRSRFDGTWCRGFELAESRLEGDGQRWFRVCRLSDRQLLAPWFARDDLFADQELPA